MNDGGTNRAGQSRNLAGVDLLVTLVTRGKLLVTQDENNLSSDTQGVSAHWE